MVKISLFKWDSLQCIQTILAKPVIRTEDRH
jgi:hypothetical protein